MHPSSDDCRVWHYLRRLTGSRLPSNWIVVHSEGLVVSNPADPDEWLDAFGACAWGTARLDGGVLGLLPLRLALYSGLALSGLRDSLPLEGCTWIVGWRIARTLTRIGWWEEIEAGRFAPDSSNASCQPDCSCATARAERPWPAMVLSDPPVIIEGYWCGRHVVIVDVLNYTSTSLEQLCTTWDSGRWRRCRDAGGIEGQVERCQCAVWSVSLWLSELLGWWSQHTLASWGATTASCAGNLWRRSYMPDRTVLVHGDARALSWERSSYYAGRCEVNYSGNVVTAPLHSVDLHLIDGLPCERAGKEIAVCDVRSMYPSIVASNPLPCHLLGHRHGERRLECLSDPADRMGVARCRIKTEYPYWPVRVRREDRVPLLDWRSDPSEICHEGEHDVIYPVGEFDTILGWVDLTSALEAGVVERVYEWYEYECADVAGGMMTDLSAERLNLLSENNIGLAKWIKLVMNSLIGKWASAPKIWVPAAGREPPCRWGEWVVGNAATGEIDRWRTLGGRVERQISRGEGSQSMPALSAAVTAFGRLWMCAIKQQLGERNWYYSDTDSIHCPAECVGNVIPEPDLESTLMGYFRWVEVARSAAYLGKRCYRLDRTWTVAGLPPDAVLESDGQWVYRSHDGALTVVHRGPGMGQRVRVQRRKLCRVDCGGVVGADGWVKPYEVTPRAR